LEIKLYKRKEGLFGCSFHSNAPLKGDKFYEDENWLCLFAGDLINDILNWEDILIILNSEKYGEFKKFEGYFAIFALNKCSNELFLISDRRSQFPIFYCITNGRISISTEMSTFCRLNIEKQLNQEWIWEYLFFNFPISSNTFLKDVKRMPPANMLKFDLNTGKFSLEKYSDKFKKGKELLKGDKAIKYASSVFNENFPKYFEGSQTIMHPLSAGVDTRTILSFNQNLNSAMTTPSVSKGVMI